MEQKGSSLRVMLRQRPFRVAEQLLLNSDLETGKLIYADKVYSFSIRNGRVPTPTWSFDNLY